MFGLVHIIMPLHARKPYPKPWLQHARGSGGESTKSGDSNFFHSISPPCLGLTELKFSDSSVTSSCMLEPGFWIWLHGMLWHYNLHQTKHFTDFAPKKCNLVTIHLFSTELNVQHIVRLTSNYRVSGLSRPPLKFFKFKIPFIIVFT